MSKPGKYFETNEEIASEYARRWVHDDMTYTAEDIDKISGLPEGHTREYYQRENITVIDPDNITKKQFGDYMMAFLTARIEIEPAFAASFLFDLYDRSPQYLDDESKKFVERYIPKPWWAESWDTPQGLGWMNLNGVYWVE